MDWMEIISNHIKSNQLYTKSQTISRLLTFFNLSKPNTKGRGLRMILLTGCYKTNITNIANNNSNRIRFAYLFNPLITDKIEKD